MFKKILFPTDFSVEANTELSCITSIPGIREIILLHVIRQSVVPKGAQMIESLAVQTAEVYLRKAKTYIESLNPDIRVMLEETASPDITGAILEKAEEHGVSLIVIHANIKGIMKGVLLDSVSSKILCRLSKINIMIMPHPLVDALTGKTYEKFCPMIFSRILCPTDFSEFSIKTIAFGGTMNRVGEIILLHVVQEAGPDNEAVMAAELRIRALCDQLTALGIRSRSIVVMGKPETEISRIAEELDVSLIWMRSPAKGCLHDFFFGSTVHDVTMHSARPVIIIRSYE